jgi:hypothetical protein
MIGELYFNKSSTKKELSINYKMWTLLYPDFKKIKLFKEILQIETPNHA